MIQQSPNIFSQLTSYWGYSSAGQFGVLGQFYRPEKLVWFSGQFYRPIFQAGQNRPVQNRSVLKQASSETGQFENRPVWKQAGSETGQFRNRPVQNRPVWKQASSETGQFNTFFSNGCHS